MSAIGFVLPAISIGLGSLKSNPRRGFSIPAGDGVGPAQAISPQITIEEIHQDELEITEHPVEQGAAIADHAYKRPAEIIIRCAWSNSPSKGGGLVGAAVGIAAALGGPVVGAIAALPPTIQAAQSLLLGNDAGQVRAIYEQLLALQATRKTFDVYTGKRVYKSMLFRSIGTETSQKTENSLVIVAVLRQVIIVSTRTISVPVNPEAQASPELTTPTEDVGQVQLQSAPTYVADPSTFSGSLDNLQGSFSEVQDIFSTMPASELGQVASSAINVLPDVVGVAQDALGEVLSQLPSPSEIPLLSNPQQLSISMNGALSEATSTISGAVNGATSALKEAMQQLPSVLESVQPAISEAVKQLPAVIDSLPSAFGNLTGVLEGVQTQIRDVLDQVPRALQRAPLPFGGGL